MCARVTREAMKIEEIYASNIVSVKQAFRTVMKENELGVLIIEACPKGSLKSICERLPPFALKEIQIMRSIRDILQGLAYLH